MGDDCTDQAGDEAAHLVGIDRRHQHRKRPEILRRD
jgi:hypothetical protein